MNKIPFEDGTKTQEAYVTINEQNYQVTPAVWTGTTPLKAFNLNKMQDNIEEAINGVVENGSNANGNYVKFEDGTMICTLDTIVSDQAINRSYGSLFWGSRTWNFPVAFIEKPAVSCGMFKWGTGMSWGNVSGITTTYATLVGIDIAIRDTGTSTEIHAIAIGRWK